MNIDMNVELLTYRTALTSMVKNASEAALTTRAISHKIYFYSMDDCQELLGNIIKLGHESVLEHITLTYRIHNISRGLLQELSRHRHISLSVESTRYTLKKNIDDTDFMCDFMDRLSPRDYKIFAAYLHAIAPDFDTLSNDELKKGLPEFFPTNLVLTLNVRELRHILKLRTAPQAFREFCELAYRMFFAIPSDFRYLVVDCVYPCNQEIIKND